MNEKARHIEREGARAIKKKTLNPPELIEDIDFYLENGLMVLSAHFLAKRGYCCGNKCRHCPYPKLETALDK